MEHYFEVQKGQLAVTLCKKYTSELTANVTAIKKKNQGLIIFDASLEKKIKRHLLVNSKVI